MSLRSLSRGQGEFVVFGGLICENLVEAEVVEVVEVVAVVAVVEVVAAFVAAVLYFQEARFEEGVRPRFHPGPHFWQDSRRFRFRGFPHAQEPRQRRKVWKVRGG